MKSKEEAVEWALRLPFEADGPSATTNGVGQIELRQVFEASDFTPKLFESAQARLVGPGKGGQTADEHVAGSRLPNTFEEIVDAIHDGV